MEQRIFGEMEQCIFPPSEHLSAQGGSRKFLSHISLLPRQIYYIVTFMDTLSWRWKKIKKINKN